MTCHRLLSLLEDYADNDLSAAERILVRQHLDSCAACRAEYETTQHVRSLLERQSVADPGREYWTEVTSLILARTVESGPPILEESVRQRAARERTTFIRSLVSAVASVSILIAALFLGSGQQRYQPKATVVADQPVLISSSLSGLVDGDDSSIVTRDEQLRLARGMFLLGSPGLLGRFPGVPDLVAFD